MDTLRVGCSPTQDANTDVLVKTVLDGANCDTEFIKLSEMDIGPCTACMDCVQTNECSIEDDFQEVGDRVLEADGLVIGSPTYYGTVGAFTKAFMERMYAFRRLNPLTEGKLDVVVSVGSANEGVVTEYIAGWMTFAGMNLMGTLPAKGAKGTICCMVCGSGEGCTYAAWNAYCEEFTGEYFGLEEAYEGYFEVLPDNGPCVHRSARILEKYRDVGDELGVI